jgi:hypothetical protein
MSNIDLVLKISYQELKYKNRLTIGSLIQKIKAIQNEEQN